MKTVQIFSFILVCCCQSFAQDCNMYFAYKKGVKLAMVSYDKKDKPTVELRYQISETSSISGGTVYKVKNQTYDPKGKLLAEAETESKCVNGVFYTDLKNINGDMIPKSADFRVSLTGDQLQYPSNENESLKDAMVEIKTEMGGMTIMKIKMNITDRKALGKEQIQTPAGSFDCLKISYKLNMKMMGTRNYTCYEYLAKGYGIIKSEQFDDKGVKQSSTILTKIE